LWASVQSNLASAYSARLRGNHAQNLESAHVAFENALTIYTSEAYPLLWAQTQNNLSVVYMEQELGERAENIENAIQCFQATLRFRTRASLPEEWAYTQNNLGNAYAERQRGDRAQNLERAIEAYDSALAVFTRDAYPECWAGAHNNLGSAFEDRVHGERTENLARAVQFYRAALEIYQPEAFPNDARRCANSLARLQIQLRNWGEAYDSLKIALGAAERLYGAALTGEGKLVEIEENTRLYRRMVSICIALTPPQVREALLFSEDGRSRLLRDQPSTLLLPAPTNIPPDLIERERALLRAARSCEFALRHVPDMATRRRWVDEAAATHKQLNALWDMFEREYSAGAYVALRRGEKLTLSDMRACLST
jgi:tetratricopeptide (TPR) repeat protein